MWKKQNESFRNVAFCFTIDHSDPMNKKEVLKRSKMFADDLSGILGQKRIEPVLARHIDFFNDLRSENATWPQIAELLKSVGVRRDDGSVLPAQQLRAMYSRRKNVGNTGNSNHQIGRSKSTPSKTTGIIKRKDTDLSNVRDRMIRAKKARTD